MNKKIEKILIKYLTNAANIDELDALTNWLKKENHHQIFKSYIKTNYAMDVNTSQFNTDKAKKEFLKKIKQDKHIIHRLKVYKALKYAAVAVIVFGLGYFFQQKNFNSSDSIIDTTPIIVNNQIEPGTDRAILTLENGEEITLEKGQSIQTQNASSNGEELMYNAGEGSNAADIAYNILTVPRGAQHYVLLSDGTKVWLNSESQIRYPVSFIKGQTRQVELLYGEAYFDVTPSTQNQGAGFKVAHKEQEVEVLGTEFNVKAYRDETKVYTILAEGKVSVNEGVVRQLLAPGEQLALDIQSREMQITTVDAAIETAWIKGQFNFKRMYLKDIMKVMSRWYDMEVIFENKSVETVGFIGSFNKNISIEKTMNIILNTGFINNYKIENKRITIY